MRLRKELDYCNDCGEVAVWCHCGLDKNAVSTFEERFKDFTKAVRKNGIKVRRNIYECCRGCVSSEKLGMKDENDPIIWHYGGQGNAIDLAGNKVYWRSYDGYNEPLCNEILFNFDNVWGNDYETIIRKMLDEQFFVYEWESPNRCLIIKVDESNRNYLFHLREQLNLKDEQLIKASFEENVTRFLSVSC